MVLSRRFPPILPPLRPIAAMYEDRSTGGAGLSRAITSVGGSQWSDLRSTWLAGSGREDVLLCRPSWFVLFMGIILVESAHMYIEHAPQKLLLLQFVTSQIEANRRADRASAYEKFVVGLRFNDQFRPVHASIMPQLRMLASLWKFETDPLPNPPCPPAKRYKLAV